MLKRLAIFLGAVLLVVVGFFGWASSGVLDAEEWATVTTYAERFPVPRDTLMVLTYNLGYLSGMTNNRPVERTRELFARNMDAAETLLRQANADFMAFQEIDLGARRSYEVHQLDTLARRLSYPNAAQAVNWDERYVPFPSANPAHHFGRVLSGQAVLSRYPITEQWRVPLERPSNPLAYPPPLSWLSDAFYIDRLAQVVQIDVGRRLLVINVHLEAWDRATREQQARQVRTLFERYRNDHTVLVLGDFNSLLPAAKTRQDLSESRRADRTIEILLDGTNLRAAFADSLVATPAAATFPADAPRYKIDHIFYEAGEIEPIDAFVLDGPDQPSDHRAVALRFVLK